MEHKNSKLHDPRRIKAAERAEDEFGSWVAFVRCALDEYDDESRLEREVKELSDELETKRERLEELRSNDIDDNEDKSTVADDEDLPDDVADLLDTPSSDTDD